MGDWTKSRGFFKECGLQVEGIRQNALETHFLFCWRLVVLQPGLTIEYVVAEVLPTCVSRLVTSLN